MLYIRNRYDKNGNLMKEFPPKNLHCPELEELLTTLVGRVAARREDSEVSFYS